MDVSVQIALISLGGILVTTFGAVIIAKLNRIHTLTNSNLTAANARLDTALAKIDQLNNLIIEMKSTT